METQDLIDYIHSRYVYKEAEMWNWSLEAKKMRLQYDKARIEQEIEDIDRKLWVDKYPQIQEIDPW